MICTLHCSAPRGTASGRSMLSAGLILCLTAQLHKPLGKLQEPWGSCKDHGDVAVLQCKLRARLAQNRLNLVQVMGREEAVKLLESSIRNRIFLDWIDFTSSTMLLLVQLQLRELFQSPPPGTSSLASILIVYNFQDWPTAGSLSTSASKIRYLLPCCSSCMDKDLSTAKHAWCNDAAVPALSVYGDQNQQLSEHLSFAF